MRAGCPPQGSADPPPVPPTAERVSANPHVLSFHLQKLNTYPSGIRTLSMTTIQDCRKEQLGNKHFQPASQSVPRAPMCRQTRLSSSPALPEHRDCRLHSWPGACTPLSPRSCLDTGLFPCLAVPSQPHPGLSHSAADGGSASSGVGAFWPPPRPPTHPFPPRSCKA